MDISLNILWHCLSLALERKLTFSSPVALAEFSKFAGILSAALSVVQFSLVQSLSRVQVFATPWTAARQASLSFAAAAAKSLQSCPTLCDPIDGSPPGFPIPGILQARTLE